MAPVIRIRTESGEQSLDLDEFEARVRRGELAGHCPVQFAPLTGEEFVRADQLEIFRRLHQPKTLYFARAFNLGRFPRLTAAFIALDVCLYLAMSFWGPIDQDALVDWGAKVAPLIWDLGELWRLVTANLLHETVLHIAFNLFVLFNVGGALENAYRPLDYLLLLCASAMGTTVVSLWALPEAVTAGASGVVYGTFGAAVVFGVKYRDLLPERYRRVLGEATIPTVLAFLYIGFTSTGVDNWAHVGGLGAGTLTALFLKPRLLLERRTTVWSVLARAAPIVGAAAALGFGGLWIGVRGPRLQVVDDDALGLHAQVPRSWIKGTERFGQIAYANGLPGVGRASFSAQAQLQQGTLDEAVEAFVQRVLVPEERSGTLRELIVHPARSAVVGELAARVLEASYSDEGAITRLKAFLIRRGEMVYELVYQWSEGYPAYESVIDRLVGHVRLVEPRAVREARARALLDPSAPTLQALGDTLARLGEAGGALAALEWAVELQPEDGDAQTRLAEVLLAAGRVDDGCRAAEAAVGFHPEASGPLEIMSRCRLAQGDSLGAVRYLRRALQAAPRDERLASKLKALLQ
ncbi:MAG: rhomboid family intramembrane serine protease [Deltaproteobacteria bacterium]|nr:rhomboid family intramembrane serine protease [Deltaproteobacteria bacterium]